MADHCTGRDAQVFLFALWVGRCSATGQGCFQYRGASIAGIQDGQDVQDGLEEEG